MVERRVAFLRNLAARRPRCALLLYLCRRLRPRRRMVRQGLYVLARKGVHHPRNRQLSRARLRSHRFFRGRHGRAAVLDRSVDRHRRTGSGAAVGATSASWKFPTADDIASGRRGETMRRLRRAKIVATLGPASSSADMIGQLFNAGVDVFRINMSHTSQDRMRELVGMIRSVERESGRPIGVLIDLQGPKLRLGTFDGGSAMVKSGDTFVLDSDTTPGDAKRACLPHPEIFATVKVGHALLIDDGKVRLKVTQIDPNRITT